MISCAVCEEGPPACPRSWVDARDVGLGCLLYNSTEDMDFVSASQYCKDCFQNASLVEILSPEQLDYITMSLKILDPSCFHILEQNLTFFIFPFCQAQFQS